MFALVNISIVDPSSFSVRLVFIIGCCSGTAASTEKNPLASRIRKAKIAHVCQFMDFAPTIAPGRRLIPLTQVGATYSV